MTRRVFITLLLVVSLLVFVQSTFAQVVGQTAPPPGTTEWRFDAKTTEVGRRAERARQFVNWVVTHPSIDNHPVFRQVWLLSATTTFFLVILVVAVMGVGLILAKKKDISFKVDVVPILNKTALLLVYTAFSYWIVLGLIQITDVVMQFFISALDANKLFTIFFNADQAQNYKFIGYRNFDPLIEESVKASWFMIDVSSFTYFVMGIVLVLRKIMLWFLLIVSPFLAILMPFRFIRNTGWIWIGVFFQWAFYGPLFALFLGALTQIWKAGIPYAFDFSLTKTPGNTQGGYLLYDLSINILYGGPQQVLGGLGAPLSANFNPQGIMLGGNSSSYADTFAEYVISLVMLWAVMILPWWLLRIFRDYCCDGIYAMKNIMLNMLGELQKPPPTPPSQKAPISTRMAQPVETRTGMPKEVQVSLKLENIAQLKQMKVEDISRRMEMSVSKVSDIARLETNTEKREYVSKVMQYMRNPMSAESSTQRSEFINLKTELSQRASRGDVAAQRLLEATTSSTVTMHNKIQELAHTKPSTTTIVQNLAQSTNMSESNVKQIANSVVQNVVQNQQTVNNIAEVSKVSAIQATQVIQAAAQTASTTRPTETIAVVSQQTGVAQEKTREVLKQTTEKATEDKTVQMVAEKEKVDVKAVKQVASKMFGAEPASPGENIVTSPTMGVEEYEEIKQMWTDHYTKGEVPVTEDIKTRAEWVQKDTAKLDNVLNKLVSENEEVRAAALQEVSDIIPFFMLGNMTIQDIATYLKAKRTAAKEVQKDIEREEEIEKKAQKKEEVEYVELEKKEKKEEALTLELETPGEKKSHQVLGREETSSQQPIEPASTAPEPAETPKVQQEQTDIK